MPATPAWPPRSAPRLFVGGPLAEGAAVTVEGNPAHYLAKVMRVAEGDAVVLCDDLTGEWAAKVVSAEKRAVVLAPVERLREREQVPDVWLCAALLKKDRFDLVLEKATELGVRAIRPLVTRRCVADKLNLERARAIVIEAAEQCGSDRSGACSARALRCRSWWRRRSSKRCSPIGRSTAPCSSPTSSAEPPPRKRSPPTPAPPRC